jgi:hypothetical protein
MRQLPPRVTVLSTACATVGRAYSALLGGVGSACPNEMWAEEEEGSHFHDEGCAGDGAGRTTRVLEELMLVDRAAALRMPMDASGEKRDSE